MQFHINTLKELPKNYLKEVFDFSKNYEMAIEYNPAQWNSDTLIY